MRRFVTRSQETISPLRITKNLRGESVDYAQTHRLFYKTFHLPTLTSFVVFLFLTMFSCSGFASDTPRFDCPTKHGQGTAGNECPCQSEWKPSQDTLDAIFNDHEEWLKTRDKRESSEHGKANLCNAYLHGADFANRDLSYADFSGAYLKGTNFKDAVLMSTNFSRAYAVGANFDEANLQGSIFNRTDLSNATFRDAYLLFASFRDASLLSTKFDRAKTYHAKFISADFRKASLNFADMRDSDLSEALLAEASIQYAKLQRVIVSDTKFAHVDLSHSLYEPVATTSPSEEVTGIRGLRTLEFGPGNQAGLVRLRDLLRRSGLRALEREATFAIEYNKSVHSIEADGFFEPLGGAAALVFFGWTVGWGLYPQRAFWVMIGLLVLFTPLYAGFILKTKSWHSRRSGIALVLPERSKTDNFGNTVRASPQEERLGCGIWLALLWALYFSALSTFNIGWQSVNISVWIRRAQFSDFELQGRGWARFFSGLHSVVSVFLFVIWIVAYFTRPFQW